MIDNEASEVGVRTSHMTPWIGTGSAKMFLLVLETIPNMVCLVEDGLSTTIPSDKGALPCLEAKNFQAAQPQQGLATTFFGFMVPESRYDKHNSTLTHGLLI